MEGKEAKTAEDINRLMQCICKNAPEDFKESIKVYSRRIIGSQMGRPLNETASELKDKIIAKVSNSTESRGVSQCQEATYAFMQSSSITKKAEVLKMLLKLSDIMANSSENLSNIFREPNKQLLQSNTLNQTQPSFNTSTLQKREVAPQRNGRSRGSPQQGVSQADILRQLSYVLQNIKGNLIHEENGCFLLKSTLKVTEPVRRIVTQLSEIGWMYRKITEGFKDEGSITKAFGLAIQEEMNEYYRWLALIENMIKTDDLTLRKLVLWSHEPTEKLKWLCIFLDAIRSYHGCQIISIINSFRPQGSHQINELLNHILAQLLQPLFQYISHWVYKGELLDSHREFFIQEKSKVDEGYEWSNKYELIESYIPNILDKESAHMIFNAGKTIYFLKRQCNSNYQLSVPFDFEDILDTKMSESNSILSIGFKKWLTQIYEATNTELVRILAENFNMYQHIQSIRHFYLLGKGDFIQHLFDNLKQELSQPKHQISWHSLDFTEEINKAFPDDHKKGKSTKKIMGSKFQAETYRNAIAYRLLGKRIDFGNDGWDCFNFEYSLKGIEPIRPILSNEVIMNYQKIFHFLWRVKRIEQALKETWLNSRLYPKDERASELFGILQFCNILRNYMSHFAINLYSYLMIAIEASWNTFMEEFKNAKSFDEMIQHHTYFQNEVLEITMNTPKCKTISQALANIFSIIMKFRANEMRFQEELSEYMDRKKQYENERELWKKGFLKERTDMPVFNQGYLIKEMKETENIYSQSFKNFFELVRKDNDGRLSVLALRLDFSEFYSNKYKEFDYSIL